METIRSITVQRVAPHAIKLRRLPGTPHPARKLVKIGLMWLAMALAMERGPLGAGEERPFGFTEVDGMARKLAQRDYEAAANPVRPMLHNLSYDQYRDIRFRPAKSLWRDPGLPFEVQFFHPGFYHNRTVTINVIDKAGVHEIPFSKDSFDYGANRPEDFPPDLGYAGFRLHYPINTTHYRDEVAAFLGASYFRAIGKGQQYGLSARGLAIDTALPHGEEFPYFREFWLEKPDATARGITVYALLDSPSVAGAYRFVIRPGEATVVDVQASIYPRTQIEKLGLAPLTSMFFYGEADVRPEDGFRPEVHDSDGLLIASASGEWIWRPVRNPRRLQVSSFQLTNPRGFGLMQRDRNFDHYQDLEARYDRRPSAWVVPRGDWGPGHIELIQIPTDSEKHDNLVAFWVPKERPVPGHPIRMGYELRWLLEDPTLPPAGRAVSTHAIGADHEGIQRFVLEFEGDALGALPAGAAVEGVVTMSSGARILEQQVMQNPVTRGWRLVFKVLPAKGKPLEMRAFLKNDRDTLTETWSYGVSP